VKVQLIGTCNHTGDAEEILKEFEVDSFDFDNHEHIAELERKATKLACAYFCPSGSVRVDGESL
jgi:hypothetical protein